jgi:hypothetical protein
MVRRNEVQDEGTDQTPVRSWHSATDWHAFSWHNVFIPVWRTQTLAGQVRVMAQHLGEFALQHRRIGLIQIVESECRALDLEAREALVETLHAEGKRIICSAVVFQGDGFRAAAMRAIVTGLNMLVQPGFPHQVFPTLATAATFATKHLYTPGTPEQTARLLIALGDASRIAARYAPTSGVSPRRDRR